MKNDKSKTEQIEALRNKIRILEVALLDYVETFGLREKARSILVRRSVDGSPIDIDRA